MKQSHLTKIRQFGKYLSFTSRTLNQVPRLSDGPLVVLSKVTSILDMTISEFFDNEPDPSEILEEMGLTSTNNRAFVSLFFGTSLRSMFEVTTLKLSMFASIVTARAPGTEIHFTITNGNDINATFWHSKNLDFKGIVEHVWKIFDDRIHVELKKSNFEFSHVFESKDPTFGNTATSMFKEFQEQHLRYVRDAVPRTYLLCGKPGVGKTAFAERLSRINSRTMRLAAASMSIMDFKTISFLVDIMKPSFLIIDDIDRNLDNERSLSTLFVIFEAFKRKHPDVTIVLTVNDVHKLDSALIRPGRIDELMDFDPPDDEDRKIIIRGYMNMFGIDPDVDISDLVKASKGLTPAYLREIALQLKYKPTAKIVKIIERMVALSSGDDDTEDNDDGCYPDECDDDIGFDPNEHEKDSDE